MEYDLSEVAKTDEGTGGLTKVVINCSEAQGEVYLHGGHVTSWSPTGRSETLYLSPRSDYRD